MVYTPGPHGLLYFLNSLHRSGQLRGFITKGALRIQPFCVSVWKAWGYNLTMSVQAAVKVRLRGKQPPPACYELNAAAQAAIHDEGWHEVTSLRSVIIVITSVPRPANTSFTNWSFWLCAKSDFLPGNGLFAPATLDSSWISSHPSKKKQNGE